ncbi:MAG TPA: SIS domain-containing protein, partial [Caldilinea sp.]|nr:SIS domain-containing protein [Caldilinea sp.]
AAGSESMQRLWSMARFPNFWPNGVVVVHLTEQERPALPGSEALTAILAARRIQRIELAAPGATRAEVAIHHLYLGNWIALYLAALYQVDPADRVPLQLLGLA